MKTWKRWLLMIGTFVAWLVYALVVGFLFLGCARHHLTIVKDDVTVKVDIGYLLQDKNFESINFNPETGEITIRNFGSVTSEIVGEAVRAGIAAGRIP